MTLFLLAQVVTIAIFASGAADPNTAKPVATPWVYTAPVPICDQPPVAETLPVSDPTEGVYEDLSRPGRTCRFSMTAQVSTLLPTTPYKGAIKIGSGLYGAFTSAFTLGGAQAAHECDTTPVSPTTIPVGALFSLKWCHPMTDTGGQPTVITSWRVYRNGVLLASTPTVGTTTSSTGFKLITLQWSEPVAATNISYVLSATNVAGQSVMSAPLVLTVTAIPTVPVAPSRGRVTQP
jgi:hypothetical protein